MLHDSKTVAAAIQSGRKPYNFYYILNIYHSTHREVNCNLLSKTHLQGNPTRQGQKASQKRGGKVMRARGQEASARWGLPDTREKLLQSTLDNVTA